MDLRYIRRIFFQTMELIRGQNSLECLKELEKTQWLSPEDLKKIQEKKLHQLIEHAYDNVPFYHKIFQNLQLKPEDIFTLQDLHRIPILKKSDIRNNWKDLIAKNYTDNDRRLQATGGSTGEPMQFFVPENQGYAWGAYWRAMSWHGISIEDKHAIIWGDLQKEDLNKKIKTKISQLLRGGIYLNAIKMTEENMDQFILKIQRFQPKYLLAFPSGTYILSKHIEKKGINNIHFDTIFTSAEKLYDHQRENFEKIFQSNVSEYYGSSEILSVGYECPEHNGFHITAENVILEVLNQNQSVLPGERGFIAITDLNNYVMPFIRYQNEDIGILSDTLCSCGRTLPLLKSVEGRVSDVVRTNKGVINSVLFFIILKDLPIKQFQIIQPAKDRLLVKIIRESQFAEKDSLYIIDTIHHYAGTEINIQIEFCDTIPETVIGKHRVVISTIEP
jgi:phenylacetate-CoA ligase